MPRRPPTGTTTADGGDPAPATLDVRTVGFTPIKGTRHLAQPTPAFDDTGPVDDRRYCLVDVHHRRVLKTVEHPSLIAVTARRHGDLLETTLPDGRSVRTAPEPSGETLTCTYWGRPVELRLTRGPHDALLSSWLGRHVRLAEAPRGAVVYGAPLTIVATASLHDLAARAGHPDLLAEASRFRATLLIETDAPYVEETWHERETRMGGVRVRIGAPVPRCAVIDLDPRTGRRNGRLLKTLASYRRSNAAGEPHFGVYAQIVGASEHRPQHAALG